MALNNSQARMAHSHLKREAGFSSLSRSTTDATLDSLREEAKVRQKEAEMLKEQEEKRVNAMVEEERREVEANLEKIAHQSSQRKAEIRLNKYCSLGSNYLSIISELLDQNVNVNSLVMTSHLSSNQQNAAAAETAVSQGAGSIPGLDVDHLLTKGQLVVESWAPLHWAAQRGDPEVLDLLLTAGAQPNILSEPYGHTPLHVAALHNQTVSINKLVGFGADIEAKSGAHDRKSHPLHMAARAGHREAIDTLLSLGCNIDATLSSGRTALLIAAANGRSAAVELLIQRGCDITSSKVTLWDVSRCAAPSTAHRMIAAFKGAMHKGKSTLDLSGCGLSHVPAALKHALNIRQLILCDNNFSTIPSALFEMGFVQQIDLRGNRLPMAVVRALWENPQPFLKDLSRGRPMRCSEMKLMIVGNENVGKTTLLRWLHKEHDDSVSMNTITTDGIAISNIALAGGETRGGVTFKAWDFAGQEIYYLTHQFFLSENGVYVLVWDMRYPPQNSRMEWWLQSIASRAHSAPVILLGTHLDDIMKSSSPPWQPPGQKQSGPYSPDDWVAKVQDMLKAEVQSRYPNIEEISFLDGEEGTGLKIIKSSLLTIANQRAQSMPHTYLDLADVADSFAARLELQGRPPVIDIDEVYEVVCRESEFFRTTPKSHFDEEEDCFEGKKGEMKRLEAGLLFLHDMGRVIFFGMDKSDGQMAGKVVLQPQWLTRCLACIVTQEVKGTYIKEGRILHSDLINFVWRSNEFPPHLHPFLLAVLEMFEVIFVMPNHPDVHIVPALLPAERPKEKLQIFPPLKRPYTSIFLSSRNLLNREYVFQFLPSGLITRLFIRMMKHYGDFKDCVYWRHGICLYMILNTAQGVAHTYVLTELHEKTRTVDLRVQSSLPSISSSVLLVVTGLVQNLIHEWYHLSPSSYIVNVPCLSCITTPGKGTPPPSTTISREHLSTSPKQKRDKSISSMGPSSSKASSPKKSLRQTTTTVDKLAKSPRKDSKEMFSSSFEAPRRESSMSLPRSLTKLEGPDDFTLKIRLETIGGALAATSLTLQIDASQTVDGVCQTIISKIVNREKNKKEEMIKAFSEFRLYSVSPAGKNYCLAGHSSIATYVKMMPDNAIYFTEGPPLFVHSSAEFSSEEPGRFSLQDCENSFMKGEMKIECGVCHADVSLPSLVPDVVLSDVEQYGCEVVQEGQMELIRKVGKGAFGDVFHGTYKGKDVAVKQIILGESKAAEILQEFQKELRLGSMLDHPNIVRIEAFTMHPFQLVMEFIPKGDLYSYLNDPHGMVKYLSRIDDHVEKEILPGRRACRAFQAKDQSSFLSLPLSVIVLIFRFALYGVRKRDLEQASSRLASISMLAFFAMKDLQTLDSIDLNYKKMMKSFKDMKDELKTKGKTGQKLIQEGEETTRFYWERTTFRVTNEEDKMSYEKAKEMHQGYLDSMDRIQAWHSNCLQALALSPELRIRLAIDIASAMAYLHSRSPPIIHRDLKTPNVLLMSLDPSHNGPLAKVSDFGASAQMFMTSLKSGTIGSDDKAKKHVVTLTTWLAPEILLGQPYSKPSDVYAVGIMMWELLTRRHPFDHLGSVMNEVKVRQKVPSDDPDNRPPVPKDGPGDFCALMRDCWAGDPDSRPPMTQVLVALVEMSQKFKSLAKVINPKELIGALNFAIVEKREGNRGGGMSIQQVQEKEVAKLEGKCSEFNKPAESSSKVVATCIALAQAESQVWVGFQDGGFKVYEFKSGKRLYHNEKAHEGIICDIQYLRGRVWTAGEDKAIRIWACNDIIEVANKNGYLWKLSPASKLRESWQKRWFVLDAGNHILHYYADSKASKAKGTISLVIKTEGGSARERNDDVKSLFGKEESASSSNLLSLIENNVSVQNVVNHKGQFKVLANNRIYHLKAASDDKKDGKNEWMAAIMAAIMKPIHPIHTIWCEDLPLSLSHMLSSDERSENILVASQMYVDFFNEQSFKRLSRVFHTVGNEGKSPLTALKPMDPFVAISVARSIIFLNVTTMRPLSGAALGGSDSPLLCLDALSYFGSTVAFAGTANGRLIAWRTNVLRTGGIEQPLEVLKTPLSSVRHIVVRSSDQIFIMGEGPEIFCCSVKLDQKKIFSEPKKLNTVLKGKFVEMGFSADKSKCFALSSDGLIQTIT